MKIKILNQIIVNGELSNLFNYKYIAEDGTPVSAVFQATRQTLKNMCKSNAQLCHFVDSI